MSATQQSVDTVSQAGGNPPEPSQAHGAVLPPAPAVRENLAPPLSVVPVPYAPPVSAAPLINRQSYILRPGSQLSTQEAAKLPFFAAQIHALVAPVGFAPADEAATASLTVDWGTEQPYQIYDPTFENNSFGDPYAVRRDWRPYRAGMWAGSFERDSRYQTRLITVYPHYVTIQARALTDPQKIFWTVRIIALSRGVALDIRTLLAACAGHMGRDTQLLLPLDSQ